MAALVSPLHRVPNFVLGTWKQRNNRRSHDRHVTGAAGMPLRKQPSAGLGSDRKEPDQGQSRTGCLPTPEGQRSGSSRAASRAAHQPRHRMQEASAPLVCPRRNNRTPGSRHGNGSSACSPITVILKRANSPELQSTNVKSAVSALQTSWGRGQRGRGQR